MHKEGWCIKAHSQVEKIKKHSVAMQNNCCVQQQRQLRSLKRLDDGRQLAQSAALEKKSKDLLRVVQDARSYQARVVTGSRSKADAFFFV